MANKIRNRAFQVLFDFVREEILSESDEEGDEGGDFEEVT